MGSLMEEKIRDTCKTYYYLSSTIWKHVQSLLSLLELDNSKKSSRYVNSCNLKIKNLKTEL